MQRAYCLQNVSTKNLNDLLKDFHQTVERNKIPNDQKFFDRHKLICLDGTGQLSSQKIKCDNCLVKTLHNGDTVYYHGQLLARLTNIKGSYNLPNVFFGLAQIAQLITELFRFWRPAKN